MPRLYFGPYISGPKCIFYDIDGNEVHRWNLFGRLGSLAYLLPNGNLSCSTVTDDGPPVRQAKGGHLYELDWEGDVI